jgi:hypothetical protein
MSKMKGAGGQTFGTAWDAAKRYIHLQTPEDVRAAEELAPVFGLQIEDDWVVGSELPIWAGGFAHRIRWCIVKINGRISARAFQIRRKPDSTPKASLLAPLGMPRHWR